MKKTGWILGMILILFSCEEERKLDVDVSHIPVEVKITRFDKLFYGQPADRLPGLKKRFPFLFPEDIPDSLWINKMQDSLLLDLKTQVDSVFPDNNLISRETENVLKHVKYYFPAFKEPEIITLYSDWDYTKRILYSDTLTFLFLDNFLGKDNRVYNGIPMYIRQTMTPQHMAPALAEEMAKTLVSPPKIRDFLSKMIYYGKILYLKKAFAPQKPDSVIIGYSSEKWKWAQENEANVWLYFLDNKILYDTDPQLDNRFLNWAPFSKFYTEADNESAGMIGQYMGWQMVKKYMNKTGASLEEMIKTPAEEIFRKSKYKP